MEQRPAGLRLVQWAGTPRGEEVLEGVIGGLLTGVPLFAQDYDPAAATLATASAIAGGIAMGMAGRKLGAGIGKRLHKDALADQSGALAFIGRTGGMESLAQGIEENGRMLRTKVADSLLERQRTTMADQGLAAQEKLDKIMDFEKTMSLLDTVEGMSDAQKRTIAEGVIQSQQKAVNDLVADLPELESIRQDLYNGTMENMDVHLKSLMNKLENRDPNTMPGGAEMKDQVLKLVGASLTGDPKPITGEHVGRAFGRFIGDEVGILGGLGAGLMASQALGWEGPKDREIARLQQQLQQQGAG